MIPLNFIILSIVIALIPLLGYWIAYRVADEMKIGGKWLYYINALVALLVFFVLPWWKAALVAGALMIGWIPALIALAFLAGVTAQTSVVSAWISIIIALFTGTRWLLDKRSLFLLGVGTVVFTLFIMGLSLLPL